MINKTNHTNAAHAAAIYWTRKGYTEEQTPSDRGVEALESLGYTVDWTVNGSLSIKKGSAAMSIANLAAYAAGVASGSDDISRALSGVQIERSDGGDPMGFRAIVDAYSRLSAGARF